MSTQDLVEADVRLVPLDDDGRVAVLATDVERAREVVERLGATLPAAGVSSTAAGVAGAAAGIGLTAFGQAATALQGMQGVVQLAPQTMALLNSGAHLMGSGGWLLGTVVGANGQIAANAAFTSVAAGTSMVTLAGTLGPAVALAAIQLQLVRIQKAVERVGARVEVLLAESREIRSTDIEIRIDRVIRESRWALEIGHVPATMLDELRGDGHALEAYCRSTVRLLGGRVDGLGRSRDKASVRQDALQRDAGQIARDVVNLHAAADCWLGYELLRATAVGGSDPDYAALIVQSAAERTDEWRARSAEQIAVLQQRLRRIDAAPGRGMSARTKRAVSDLARQLAEAVAEAIPAVEPPTPEAADALGLDPEQRERLLQELRWRTDDGALLLLAGVSIPRTAEIRGIDMVRGAPRAVTGRDGFIAVRATRVVVGIVKDFVEDGALLLDLPRFECLLSDSEPQDGAFDIGADGETLRVLPHDEQRRMSPSLLRTRVQRAVDFVPFAALASTTGSTESLEA